MSWVIERIGVFKHILPIGEEHSTEDCPCNPLEDEDLIIHNSFDGRETFERGERKPS